MEKKIIIDHDHLVHRTEYELNEIFAKDIKGKVQLDKPEISKKARAKLSKAMLEYNLKCAILAAKGLY